MEVFARLKELSKFFIIMAMAAIGLHTNIIAWLRQGKADSHGDGLLDRNSPW